MVISYGGVSGGAKEHSNVFLTFTGRGSRERERGDSLNSAQINYLQYFFNRKKSSLQEKEKKERYRDFEF